jgi:E3 ubiquitin-protein ligase UBR1
MDIASNLADIGLVVSIRSARETFKEQLCDICISFLKSLAYLKGRAVSQKQALTIRDIICEELCSEWRRKSNKNNVMTHQDNVAEMEDDFIDIVGINPEEEARSGIAHQLDMDRDMDLHQGDFADDAAHRSHIGSSRDGDAEMTQAGHDEDTLMTETASSAIVEIHPADPSAKSARAGPPHRRLRIDRLLLLDLKFWKMPRASLRELYIGTLVLSPKYKKFMGTVQADHTVQLLSMDHYLPCQC